MKTTKRFERAIEKLYNAFHNGTLDAMNCSHCAVGNLCDNKGKWLNVMSKIGDDNRLHFSFFNDTEYSNDELIIIERVFIYGTRNNNEFHLFRNNISTNKVGIGLYTKEEQKELQFKGLCAVIEYLAELDGIDNPMDYSKLFEQVDDKPKYELSF